MKKLRPWLYFVSFILVYAALSKVKDADYYLQYVWLTGMIVLSVVTVWRWWQDPHDARDVGFGVSRLPLPRRWKRWFYDEP